MNTLYLDQVTGDLTLDTSGNIAMATDPYSLAQDAASAIKTYLGEVYFDTTLGIPYNQILGNGIPLSLYRAQAVQAALTVPGVVSASVIFNTLTNRTLSGQVFISTVSGQSVSLTFSSGLNSTTATVKTQVPNYEATAIPGYAIPGFSIPGVINPTYSII